MLGECVVKIKDITEGLYDYLTAMGQKKTQADWNRGTANKTAYMDKYEKAIDQANRDYRTATNAPAIATQGQAQATGQFKTNPARTTPQAPIPNPKEGSVLLVKAPNGEEYFKSYTGSWHQKGKMSTDFSVGGTKITEPKDIVALDRLVPNGKLVGVKLDPRDPTGNAWVYDKRNTALLAKRSGNK